MGKQVQTLRRSLPEGTTMSVVKNKLMKRAIDGTEYDAGETRLSGANMWFFTKEANKKETHTILGGVIDGQTYDSTQCEQIGKLPSKLELIGQIAGSIKAVPTKVGRVIKAPNSKLARAIKLATEKNTE